MLTIYAESMKETLLPIFRMLVEQHDMIPIWLDVPPGGIVNLTTGEQYDHNKWSGYFKILPRYNEIGRQMMVDAGGLVVPHWDVTFPRWNDHVLGKPGDHQDQLHWCFHRRLSVPAVWLQLLAQVLYGNDNEETQAINSSSSSTEASVDQPVLRSLQGGAADVNEQQPSATRLGRRMLVAATNPVSVSSSSIVPVQRLSSSNQSPCECANAKDMNHCRANIRCSWNAESGVCLERV